MSLEGKEKGRAGERIAEAHLVSLGHRILFRNYSCPLGEIDLIGRHLGVLVFVEVKTRKGRGAGAPEEAVTPRKIAQIRRVARWFLKEKRLGDCPCRFDVVAIDLPVGSPPAIRFYPNAFPGFEAR